MHRHHQRLANCTISSRPAPAARHVLLSSRSRASAPHSSSSTQQSSATPPPGDAPTPPQPPQQATNPLAPFTLIERQGRNQTTHTWSYSPDVSETASSSSTTSTVEDENSTSSSPPPPPVLSYYSRTQQPIATSTSSSNNNSSSTQQQQQQQASTTPFQAVSDALSALYLPAGYPISVTDDYLPYQLATVPAHITGWLSIGLTTSSLLKAVGISAGPVGATAAAAAIKWIVKDGIGAAGRLLVGGRLGLEFDEDPRRWRMTAEALTTLGLALEIATAAYPQNFLLLASLGNFSKAVGKGMGKPVFRVVQTHFAAAGVNVGAVAAKEEVWEVSAQLGGYALSVLLLQQLQDAGRWQTVVGIWALVQGAHVAFRYAALKTLRFRYLNLKRAKLLVCAHVRNPHCPLLSVAEGNQQEPLFASATAMTPHITFGCSLAEAWGVGDRVGGGSQGFAGVGVGGSQGLAGQPMQQLEPQLLGPWWELYQEEGYALTWREGKAAVVLKEAAVGLGEEQEEEGDVEVAGVAAAAAGTGGGQTVQQQQQGLLLRQQQEQQRQQQVVLLRALWQAAWLDAHQHQQQQQPQQQQQHDLSLLAASLAALNREFDGFMSGLAAAGWRTDQFVVRVGAARVAQQQQQQRVIDSEGGGDAYDLDV